MSSPTRVVVHDHLTPEALAAVRHLVEEVTAAQGGPPLGEHKHTQLEAAGGNDWSGVLAYDDSRRLTGYAHLRWNPPGVQPRAATELVCHPTAHPSRAGPAAPTGHALLEAAEQEVARRGGGLLWVWCHRVTDPAAALPAARGYRVQRRLAFLRRALSDPPEPPLAPPGVMVRAYQGPSDDAEFLRVNNAAFEGHPENGGWTPEVFAARRSLGWFDPDDLLLAWRGERLAGFHWTKRHPAGPGHQDPVGEVYVLAVDPDEHGGGLGRFLLLAGLAHLHHRGCHQVVLYVDRAQPAALRLYHATGFRDVHDEVCFERDIGPV